MKEVLTNHCLILWTTAAMLWCSRLRITSQNTDLTINIVRVAKNLFWIRHSGLKWKEFSCFGWNFPLKKTVSNESLRFVGLWRLERPTCHRRWPDNDVTLVARPAPTYTPRFAATHRSPTSSPLRLTLAVHLANITPPCQPTCLFFSSCVVFADDAGFGLLTKCTLTAMQNGQKKMFGEQNVCRCLCEEQRLRITLCCFKSKCITLYLPT